MSLLLLLFPYRSGTGTYGRPPNVKQASTAGPKVKQASTAGPKVKQSA